MGKKVSKKAAREAQEKAYAAGEALAGKIRSLGLASEVVATYDSAQTTATGQPEYVHLAAADRQEEAEAFANAQALEHVKALLVGKGVVEAGVAIYVVDLAYSEVA